MKQLEKIIFIFVVALVSFIHVYAYRIWLFSTGVLTDGDWFLSLPEHSQELLSLPSMWMTYVFGSVNLTPPFYPFMLLEGFLSSMGMQYALIERVTFMWPIALLTIPIIYLLIKSITSNKLASLIGAIVYAYNTYFIIIQTGHLTLMMGFTLAPLVILFFIKSLEQRSYFYSMLTGFFAFMVSFFEFRSFFLVVLICLLYYLYYLFIQHNRIIFSELRKTVLIATIPLGIALLLNIYWILPLLTVSNVVVSSVYNRDFFGNEFFNIIRSFTLFHPFWTGGEIKAFVIQDIPIYFYITPLLAFAGLYLNRKNKKVVFFGLLALIGIFLSKQNNQPFTDIYSFLYFNVPGFGVFREASKFYFLTALGYAVLIGAFVQWLLQTKTKRQWHVYGKYTVVLLLVGMYLYNVRPLITGEIGTLFSKREMPADYKVLNTFLAEQNNYFRTAWLPNDSRWSPHTDLHPKISITAALAEPWSSHYEIQPRIPLGTQYIDFMNKPISNTLLDIASVKYIIVPLRDTVNNDDFYINYGRERNDYIHAMDTIQNYKKLSIDTKDVSIYENLNLRPHIYLTQEPESVAKTIPFEHIQFERNSTTSYQLKLTLSKPAYIQFSDTYHPDWNLYPGDFKWFDILSNNTQIVTDQSKNAAQMNSFYVDPQKICTTIVCERAGNGSYIMNMRLFFTPQAYMYAGSIVSISVLAISILIFLLLFLRKFYYGKKR